MLTFKNCAGAEDIQSVDSEHDMDMTLGEQPVLLNTADTEECRRRMTH